MQRWFSTINNFYIPVVPHVGTWIETKKVVILPLKTTVAPHAVAWIETYFQAFDYLYILSCLMWGVWIETDLNVFVCVGVLNRTSCRRMD